MTRVQLTLKSIRARPVVLPLKRPIVSRVGLFEPFQLKKGHLMVPDRPGQGIEWNEKAIARFAC